MKTVGRSSNLRLLLVPLGHTSTTTEADTLQIWSGKAVKACHSENNLTLLPKERKHRFTKLYTTWKALQVKLQIYSMRGEFIFFSTPRSSLLKLSLFVILTDESTQSYLCVVRPLDMLLDEGIKKTSSMKLISSPSLWHFNFFPTGDRTNTPRILGSNSMR